MFTLGDGISGMVTISSCMGLIVVSFLGCGAVVACFKSCAIWIYTFAVGLQ